MIINGKIMYNRWKTGEYVYGIEEENVRKNIGIIGGFWTNYRKDCQRLGQQFEFG
jgi:hypothetical protein